MNIPDGFDREDLACVADSLLSGYDKTVNVGNVTGEGDEVLESSTAYAARFIQSALSAAPTPPAQENQWQQAVLNECFAIEGCYKESDPAGTIACLINWHVLNERDHVPAQDDEPVLFVNSESIKGLHKLMASRKRTDAFNMPLYTHPDTSELRKAARAYIDWMDNPNNHDIVEGSRLRDNLRAELNKGKSC